MATISPNPKLQFFDNDGNPLSGGMLYTFEAGTTTPIATYTDSTQAASNTNPVICDSRGECSIWLKPEQKYLFVLTDANGNEIWAQDNISNNVPFVGEFGTSTTSLTVGLGQQTFFIERNKNFVVGMVVQIAYTANAIAGYMNGVVTAYTASTGEMVVSVTNSIGSGTYEDWTVSLSAPPPNVIIETATGTSTTSLTIGTGPQTLTTQLDLSFVAGMTVQVANTAAASTNYMNGIITTYDAGTGEMVVEVLTAVGSGTYTAWTISLSAPVPATYTLPTASAGTLGGVKVGTGLSINTGVLSADPLPTASADTLGGVKVGTGLTINAGVLSAEVVGGYVLPTASANILGGVKIGTDMSIVAGVLHSFPAGTAIPFFQASAPTGWTKSTTHNDKALRVVSTSGGGTGGTHDLTAPPSLAHTHTMADHSHTVSAHSHTVASHSHTMAHVHQIVAYGSGANAMFQSDGNSATIGYASGSNGPALQVTVSTPAAQHLASNYFSSNPWGAPSSGAASPATDSAGSGSTSTATGAASGSTTPTAFAPKYVDVIICTKD